MKKKLLTWQNSRLIPKKKIFFVSSAARLTYCFSVLFLSLIACQHSIPVDPQPIIPSLVNPYPLKVGILIDKATLNKVSSQGNICLLGFSPVFNIPVGRALEKSSRLAFQQLFTKVTRVRSEAEAKILDLDLLIIPRLQKFVISQFAQTYFSLNLEIIDRRGKSFYEDGFEQEKLSLSSTCLLGPLMAKKTISNSVNRAFEAIFFRIIKRLRKNVNWDKIIARLVKQKEFALGGQKKNEFKYKEEESILVFDSDRNQGEEAIWKISLESVQRDDKDKLIVRVKFENISEEIQQIRFSSRSIFLIDWKGKKIVTGRPDKFGLVTSSMESIYPQEFFIKNFLFDFEGEYKDLRIVIDKFVPLRLQ